MCTDATEPVEREKLIQSSNPYDHYLLLHQFVPGLLEYHWESANLICGICSVTRWFCDSRNNTVLLMSAASYSHVSSSPLMFTTTKRGIFRTGFNASAQPGGTSGVFQAPHCSSAEPGPQLMCPLCCVQSLWCLSQDQSSPSASNCY